MAAKKAEKTLKITLVKSTIGQVPKAKATIEAMGLRNSTKCLDFFFRGCAVRINLYIEFFGQFSISKDFYTITRMFHNSFFQ